MDNLSSHKRVGVQAAIEAVGASLLYLPPYSPDFNPLELAFAKFKWLLKSAAHRTVDALWQACGELLHHFTATECRNYRRHCGYRYIGLMRSSTAKTTPFQVDEGLLALPKEAGPSPAKK